MTETISWVSAIIFLVIAINLIGFLMVKYSDLPDEDIYASTEASATKTIYQSKQIRLVTSNKRRKPGKRNHSAISQAIKEDYGSIMSRSERRKMKPFIAYYNIGG